MMRNTHMTKLLYFGSKKLVGVKEGHTPLRGTRGNTHGGGHADHSVAGVKG